jgi:hypothetical protein
LGAGERDPDRKFSGFAADPSAWQPCQQPTDHYDNRIDRNGRISAQSALENTSNSEPLRSRSMNHSIRIAVVLIAGLAGFGAAAQAQSDPPGRVGRLAFTEGTVSFHDDQEADWSPAVINTPLTSGDAVWTEPNARSELSIAGTRVRMDNATQLDMLAIDDIQTRLQIDRGRIDIKTFTLDTHTPYQIVTPRGTITLREQGDYYVEAGTTEDATRLGVRSGAAQIESLNGQVLAVRPGEVGEISGDTGTPQLRTVNSAPPPPVSYWAARDRQVSYDPPAQYLSSGVTGYEDLNAYGSWSNDGQYGNVWSPRSVPSGWQPYRTGHWSNVKPWGWTWIDDQPWGYAPYHYGRWANSGNRWVWVPPQREVQPVYAPALVAFIGGIELAVTLGNQNNSPVGWFPLGPRETYVPSYSTNRDYYNRINQSAQVQPQVLESRWQATQRHEAVVPGQNPVLANQRFATVVPANVFVRSQPVARATLQVSPAQLAAAPVAPVAAPPAPTASIATAAPATTPGAAKPADRNPPASRSAAPAPPAGASLPVTKTAVADMPTLAKPAAATAPTAPGPKIATAPSTPAATINATGSAAPNAQGRTAPPQLQPRVGSAPPVLNDNKATTAPASAHPQPSTAAPAAKAEPSKAEPAKPAPVVATPAAPAAPAPKPPVTKPEATVASPPPAAPQTGQQPQPVREPNKKDNGASNEAPLPSHPASPPAMPQVATPAPQPIVPPPQVVAPASQQHATPVAIPQPAPPPHVAAVPPPPPVATPAPPAKATVIAPALTQEEKKDEKK